MAKIQVILINSLVPRENLRVITGFKNCNIPQPTNGQYYRAKIRVSGKCTKHLFAHLKLPEITAFLDCLRGQNHDEVISRRKINAYFGESHDCSSHSFQTVKLIEENGPSRSFGSAWFSLAILIIVRQNNFTPTFLVCYTF